MPHKKQNLSLHMLDNRELFYWWNSQEESLACCLTLPLPPLSSMHNLRYKNYFGIQVESVRIELLEMQLGARKLKNCLVSENTPE